MVLSFSMYHTHRVGPAMTPCSLGRMGPQSSLNYMGILQGRSIYFVYFLLIQTVESRTTNMSLEREYLIFGKENDVLEGNVVFHLYKERL